MIDRSARTLLTAMASSSIGAVLYTYAGYPALLWMINHLRPGRVAGPTSAVGGMSASNGDQSAPWLSVIVAAHNEQAVIRRRLDNLERSTTPRDQFEIIVVDDGSTDRTAEFAERPGVRVLRMTERGGKSAALNRAVEEARGRLLVFSDANNDFAPDTVDELIRPFEDPRVGVVTGRRIIVDDLERTNARAESLYWRYESAVNRWETSLGSVTAVTGEVLAVRREAYVPLAAGTINDDLTLGLEAACNGWRLAYAPDARSYEPAAASLQGEETRRARIVAGRYRVLARLLPRLLVRRPLLAWQLISHKGLRPVVPVAMAIAAVANLPLLGDGRRWRVVGAAQLAFYGLAVAGAVDARAGRRHGPTYLPYYLCRMNLAALRGLGDLLRRRDVTRWQRVRRADESDG